MVSGNRIGSKPARALSVCDREPIHIPGAIQPHGAVLAVAACRRRVSHASANLAAILGLPAEVALGQPLEAAVGEAACRDLLQAAERRGQVIDHDFALPGPEGRSLHLRAHRSGGRICIDIEPVPREPALE